jgi:hypothetical protein
MPVFLQNNGIQVATVSFAQDQRYPKNTPKQTLFHIKQNKNNKDKYTITSDLQHLVSVSLSLSRSIYIYIYIYIKPLSGICRIFSTYSFSTPERSFQTQKTLS